MPDLHFQVEGAEPQRYAAAPLLHFRLRVAEAVPPAAPATPIQSVLLHCQVRIEPARRRYSTAEQDRLRDLFGTPERWGQTVRPFHWTDVALTVPPFTGSIITDLPVPCSFDFSVAATRYFAALEEGDLPLCFLFSGTIFYETAAAAVQVARIPWTKEASFRLPAAAWHELMDHYYPNTAWLGLHRDMFRRLDQYRSDQGLPTIAHALERLLAQAKEPTHPTPSGAEGRIAP